jgi:hypothetical protein
MCKRKLIFLCLVVAALLVANSAAFAQIDPCNSTAAVVLDGAPSLPVVLPTCPQGDGGSMIAYGWYIALTIRNAAGLPIPGIPASDFWIVDCDAANTLIVLCGGSASSAADAATDALGKTTMSQTQPAISTLTGPIGCITATPPCSPEPAGSARCTDGVYIIVQSVILDDQTTNCTTKMCYPINVRSCDLTGDGCVSSADLSTFAIGYTGGVGWPNPCIDFSASGTINLPDLAFFALHFGPPGHCC